MAELILKNIKKSFGNVNVIKGIDLEIEDGEFVVFVGPSGCGKSTMLRLISGLETVTDGQIFLEGNEVTNASPSDRELAMVFQSYALFPHMTVAENIGFGLKLKKIAQNEIDERVKVVAETLKITNLLERTPRELSGGQRQRVAIGRAIIRDPKLFLFDEPLSNLDAALRVQMRLEISRLHDRLKTTMIYVTHDQVEAMTLADRIVVFNGGVIEQQGEPIELYDHPANIFVAGFIGAPAMNLIPCKMMVENDQQMIALGANQLPFESKSAPSDMHKITFGIRPEHLSVVDANGDFEAQVEIIEDLGNESLLYLQTDFSEEPLTVRVDPETDYQKGQKVSVAVERNKMHVFDSVSGKNIMI